MGSLELCRLGLQGSRLSVLGVRALRILGLGFQALRLFGIRGARTPKHSTQTAPQQNLQKIRGSQKDRYTSRFRVVDDRTRLRAYWA